MSDRAVTQGLKNPSAVYETEMGGARRLADAKSLPALGPAILVASDCRSTLREIHQIVASQASYVIKKKFFLAHARAWQRALAPSRVVHTLRR